MKSKLLHGFAVLSLVAFSPGQATAGGPDGPRSTAGPLLLAEFGWVVEARLALAADSVGFPLLVPGGALPESAMLTLGPTWYAITMSEHGVHVSVHGIGQEMYHSELAAEISNSADEDGAFHVAESHAIWSVTFRRDRVAYVLDYECASGDLDVRCASPDAALAVAESLVAIAVPQ